MSSGRQSSLLSKQTGDTQVILSEQLLQVSLRLLSVNGEGFLINFKPHHLRRLESGVTTMDCYPVCCRWQAELGHVASFRKPTFEPVRFLFQQLGAGLNSLSLICQQYDIGLAFQWLAVKKASPC